MSDKAVKDEQFLLFLCKALFFFFFFAFWFLVGWLVWVLFVLIWIFLIRFRSSLFSNFVLKLSESTGIPIKQEFG